MKKVLLAAALLGASVSAQAVAPGGPGCGWGNLIFESWDPDMGWNGYDENGRLLPMGVYVYKLELRFVDGTSSVRIGDVTLIR